jgi:histidinol dehydrogenase
VTDIRIRRLSSASADFWGELQAHTAWDPADAESVDKTVCKIIERVRRQGDEAVVAYARDLDGFQGESPADLAIPAERFETALLRLAPEQRDALELAAHRLTSFHERQLVRSWSSTEADGTRLGQRVMPLERVGVYVPGGKAAYPSTVLMNAIPAQVAGVAEIVMTVPAPGGVVSDLVLAAAGMAGIDRGYTVGGAQAVAALAYGTETIPRVDKIVGPGNAYVAAAKRRVFGAVGIDMIAGPSEILIVCDGETPPEWLAMDLFSQAEHDEDAQAILVSPDRGYLDRVEACMGDLLPRLERRVIIRTSLERRGALIEVRDLEEACRVANRVAPEHLELSVDDPDALLPMLRHAGAIFLGRHTAEALGDYCAGPNHVLPTSATSRFSSPLGVYDFQKRTSLIHCSPEGADRLGPVAARLARGEGLTAHALSAEYRLAGAREPSGG